MTSIRIRRANENGSALMLVLVMTIICVGLITALSTLTLNAARQTEDRLAYSSALEIPEAGLHVGLAAIQNHSVRFSGDEYVGFVDADLVDGSADTRILCGSMGSADYIVRMRSAYLTHLLENSNWTESQSLEPADGFLRLVPKSLRDDPKQSLFDYYHVLAYVTRLQRDAAGNIMYDAAGNPLETDRSSIEQLRGLGRHEFRRGVEAVLEIRKVLLKDMVPAPLYIDGTPDPAWNGSSWRVHGADHLMTGPVEQCGACGGTGKTSALENACGVCGGDGEVDVRCETCHGSGRSGGNCYTCDNTGLLEDACSGCAGAGRVFDNGAPAGSCSTCGGDGFKDNGQACNKCNVCSICHGTGFEKFPCDVCSPCAACGGDGLVPQTCSACTGSGIVSGQEVDCATCGADGLVDVVEHGQPNEELWRKPGSTDHKPAIGYPGSWDQLSSGMNDGTQVSTLDADGNRLDGEAATTATRVDLRELATAFVGGPATDPLQPDLSRLTNNIHDLSTTGSGAGPNGFGDAENFHVSYVKVPEGDRFQMTSFTGGGVLVIDGDAKFSGQSNWYGLVIVLGNMTLSGGGNGTHIYGACMGAEMKSDPVTGAEEPSDSTVSGQSDIWWSQDAMDKIMRELKPSFRTYPVISAWRSLDKNDVQSIAP